MTEDAEFEAGRRDDPYRAPLPIPALARFTVAALWTAGVFWASGVVYALFPGHELIPGLLSRVLACVLTAVGFVFFLRVLDYNGKPLDVALALPLNPIAGRQFGTGLALGALLMATDVSAIACLGRLQFHFHFSLHILERGAAVA